MNRLRDEAGMTLPELLTAMTIALVVSFATFSFIEFVMKRSGEVSARVETTATARTAMDQLTRQLRSQVCAKRPTMGQARSLDVAGPTTLTVFADFTNENYGGGTMPAPDLRKIDWAGGTFTETVTKGVRNTTDNSVSYSGAGTQRQFLANVVATRFYNGDKTKPIFFRYYKFPEPAAGQTELPADVDAQPSIEVPPNGAYRNLTEAELLTVAKVTVEFEVLPRSGPASAGTALQSEIYVRTADPNAQTPKPTCLTY